MSTLLELFAEQAPSSELIGPINQVQDEEEFEALGEELARFDESVRLHAAVTLGQAGNPEALATLARLCADPSEAVREQALLAVERLGGDVVAEAEIGDLLRHDASPSVRRAAALALAVTRTPGARDWLQAAQDDPDPDVRERVRQLLSRLG